MTVKGTSIPFERKSGCYALIAELLAEAQGFFMAGMNAPMGRGEDGGAASRGSSERESE